MGLIPKNPEIYDLVSSLKVTRSKARNLLYESKLRTTNSNALDSELKEILVKPIFLKDGDKISLEIGNPFLIDHMRSKLKELGHITDGSFSSELVKLTTDAYLDLFISMLGDDENQENIRKKFIECGAKEETSLKGVIKSIITKGAAKVAGKAGEHLVGDLTTGYLEPIMKGTIDTTTGVIKDFISDYFGNSDNNPQN